MSILDSLPIQKPVEELTIDEMETNLFYIFNNSLNRNFFIDYVKRNNSEMVQVLNEDGTINKDIKFGTPEYRAYVDAYVKKHDTGKLRIFCPDGKRNILKTTETREVEQPDGSFKEEEVKSLNSIYKEVNSLYSDLENNLIRIVPKHLTEIHAGEPGYDPNKVDSYEIKYPTDSEKLGIINCDQKNIYSVLNKIKRLAMKGTADLDMSDAINKKYHGKLDELLNEVSDHARMSFILDSWDDILTIVSHMQIKFGGLPKVNNKLTYKAVHLNTRLCLGEHPDETVYAKPRSKKAINHHGEYVNVELQFHTKNDMRFKIVDDIVYHSLYGSTPDLRSDEGQEMVAINKLMETYANVIISRGSFMQQKPLLEDFIDDCVRKGAKKPDQPVYDNIGVYFAEAFRAQPKLVKYALSEAQEIDSILSKKQNTWGLQPDKKFDDREM